MKRYVQRNEKGKIIAVSAAKLCGELIEEIEDSRKINIGYDGYLYYEDEMRTSEYLQLEKEFLENQKIEELRKQRETECFSVINRGQIWYDTLLLEQKHSLIIWYHEWLDVTKTKNIPPMPAWINESETNFNAMNTSWL